MVVNQIDVAGFAGRQAKNDSPVSRYAHGINTPSVTTQFVQSEAGLSHMLDCSRGVQARQDTTYLREMLGVDAARIVSEIQPLQSSMLEVLDHEESNCDT